VLKELKVEHRGLKVISVPKDLKDHKELLEPLEQHVLFGL
jgi:hypothetical protein